ncbi:hypothetical protein ETAA8_06950 [Anatilimnocola aggregata]|uniref:PilZ domain-containing protein n=1 Tax=Anatilimnocola aggregata TaxID=2528021 RepID=A0A517Y5W7_9BACT|nr:PilZ domain-containing protein [Anatilimnocola aggregata]QDU25625.1 hypothetical protein ETAA8_06950 [Anatilimnocola aggregata]
MNSSEQRNAFRIQMPDGQKKARLRIEGRSFDVQLLDASSTGVAIACPLTVGLEIDDKCELHTPSGGSFIRIVRKEVFSDGILLGAERTGDLSDAKRGWLAAVLEFVTPPKYSVEGFSAKLAVGWAAGLVLAICGMVYACWHFGWLATHQPLAAAPAVQLPLSTPVVEEQLQQAVRTVEAALPEVPVVTSESDLRALKIFNQQKLLLLPETARRLRLTPAQESQIQRAVEAAAAAAADTSRNDFWESIRRSEVQILSVLSPGQVKAWRQLNGT